MEQHLKWKFEKIKSKKKKKKTWTVWDWMLRTRPVSEGRTRERIGGAICEFLEFFLALKIEIRKINKKEGKISWRRWKLEIECANISIVWKEILIYRKMWVFGENLKGDELMSRHCNNMEGECSMLMMLSHLPLRLLYSFFLFYLFYLILIKILILYSEIHTTLTCWWKYQSATALAELVGKDLV